MRRFYLAALLAVAQAAHAEDCTDYRYVSPANVYGSYFTDRASACADIFIKADAQQREVRARSEAYYTSWSLYDSNGDGTENGCRLFKYSSGYDNMSASNRTQPCACSFHPQGTERHFRGPAEGAPVSMCIDRCKFDMDGVELTDVRFGSWAVTGTSTGTYCTGVDDGTEHRVEFDMFDPNDPGEVGTGNTGACIDSGNGFAACTDLNNPRCSYIGQERVCSYDEPTGQCGQVNGEYTCLSQLSGTNQCVTTSNGAGFCIAGTSTPPGPVASDGTSPAAPDLPFTHGTGTNAGSNTTYNYYTSNTMGGNGAPDGGGGSGGDGGTGGEGGEPDPDEPGECDPTTAICDPFEGEEEPDGVPSFGEAASNFWGEVSGGQWGNVTAGLGGSLSANANCPTYETSLPIFGTNLEMTQHCTLIEEQRALFSAVFTFLWSLTGLLIILEA